MSIIPLAATATVATPEATATAAPAQIIAGLAEQTMPFLVKIPGVLVVFIIGLVVAAWLQRMTTKACTRSKLDPTLGKFFGSMVRTVFLALVVLICLGTFGVEVTSITAIFAAAGFAVALALQGSLSNIAAGVMLLIFRPFKVDDAVNVAGVTGKVVEIQLFSTTIDTFDNRRITIPNGSIFGAVIENITFHPRRRVDVPVGVEYSADIDKTREVLEGAADRVPGRLGEPEPAVVLLEFGASSIDWVVRVWAPTPDFFTVKQGLIREIKNALRDAEIGIPFPQMDVHLDKLD